MLFFQTFLLGAYAYAHLTVRYLTPRKQALLHTALLLAALALLPIVPHAHWKPGPTDEPIGRILLLLTVCLGLPYFVLARPARCCRPGSAGCVLPAFRTGCMRCPTSGPCWRW